MIIINVASDLKFLTEQLVRDFVILSVVAELGEQQLGAFFVASLLFEK